MKYYFIFCLYLIFILPLSAQERKERPQFKLGGALRFNYNFSDWNSGHRDRGGDLGYDVFMLRPTASYKGFCWMPIAGFTVRLSVDLCSNTVGSGIGFLKKITSKSV